MGSLWWVVPLRLLVLVLGLVLTACAAPPSATDPAGGGAPRPPTAARPVAFHGAPLAVGFLIVDGVYNTELTAPLDVFHHTVFHTDPGMTVFTVGPDTEPVTSFEGLRLLPDFTYDDAPPIDVLVVPSAEHSMDSDLLDEAMMAFVRRTGRAARILLSLCDGAFVLAEAGLLDGRRATTFPADVAPFRERFPAVEVDEQVSFVHDDKAVTSAGGALSFEAALYLCERLYGDEVAREIARGLCLDWDLSAVRHVRTDRAAP